MHWHVLFALADSACSVDLPLHMQNRCAE